MGVEGKSHVNRNYLNIVYYFYLQTQDHKVTQYIQKNVIDYSYLCLFSLKNNILEYLSNSHHPSIKNGYVHVEGMSSCLQCGHMMSMFWLETAW